MTDSSDWDDCDDDDLDDEKSPEELQTVKKLDVQNYWIACEFCLSRGTPQMSKRAWSESCARSLYLLGNAIVQGGYIRNAHVMQYKIGAAERPGWTAISFGIRVAQSHDIYGELERLRKLLEADDTFAWCEVFRTPMPESFFANNDEQTSPAGEPKLNGGEDSANLFETEVAKVAKGNLPTGDGMGANGNEGVSGAKLKPCVIKAWQQHEKAIEDATSKQEELKGELGVYEWYEKYLLDDDETLPSFETWAKYVRVYKLIRTGGNLSKGGVAHETRSVVRAKSKNRTKSDRL
jgi:hypothetical protein